MFDLNSFCEKAYPLGLLGIRILQNEQLVGEAHCDGEIRRNIYSASKSFTSTAVGIAIKEGLLSLDEKLTAIFPEALPESVCEALAQATLRDALTMCLGQTEAHLMGVQRPQYEEHDWLKIALSQPFSYNPGERFLYNNVGPYLAGLAVQKRAGCDLVDYLMPRLFEPLGITRPVWECDPFGRTFGAGGLMLTVSELEKLGLLYLNRGRWNDKQIVPESWVDACSKPQDDPNYSYLFWIGRDHSFRADGKYGQFSIVLPEQNTVISTVAESREQADLLNLIHDTIVPMLS